MKNFPIPDKKPKNNNDIMEHVDELVLNCLHWLMIEGYTFIIYLPNNKNHFVQPETSATITVEYPYKKFALSVQQDTIEKMLSEPISNVGFWKNLETAILHECIHILLWKTGELARRRYTTHIEIQDENEATTDHLTHIIDYMINTIRKKHIIKKWKT